jgi:NTE family protein
MFKQVVDTLRHRLRRTLNLSPPDYPDKLALVMSGGGARGAYQAGILRYIAKQFPDFQAPILTGVSAGAINATHLANRAGSFSDAVESLAGLWNQVDSDTVFESQDNMSLMWKVLRRQFQSKSDEELNDLAETAQIHGLFNTAPLWNFLRTQLREEDGQLLGIERNIAAGQLEALAVTTANYTTGQSITWVQGDQCDELDRPNRRIINAPISVEHVMASSALPFLFSAVKIGETWHGDGGIRLSAPLSPAVHLHATRILAISTRYSRSQAEADTPEVTGYPPTAQVLGILMNAIFLDLMDQDALTLERINNLVRELPPSKRGGFREVKLLLLRPSQDLAALARDYIPRISGGFRLFNRSIGTGRTRMPRWLSMILFEPAYIQHVMEIGETDAAAQIDQIGAFLENDSGTM